MDDLEILENGAMQSKLAIDYTLLPITNLRHINGFFSKESIEQYPDIHLLIERLHILGDVEFTLFFPTPELRYRELKRTWEIATVFYSKHKGLNPKDTEVNGAPMCVIEALAQVRTDASNKYPESNWKGISFRSHISHALNHAYLFFQADTSESHLEHLICRLFFAFTALDSNEKTI
jgi:hypothetical protein